MTDKLLPCPFCGGEAKVKDGGPGNKYAQCVKCYACTDDHVHERAISAWNARAIPAAPIVKVKALVWKRKPLALFEMAGREGEYCAFDDGTLCAYGSPTLHGSLSAAKAAAQADYEARILAALEVTP